MPEPATKLAERLDTLEADLADARDERDRIERTAAEARAEGRDDEAESLLADLPAARDRVSNLEGTVPIVRDQLNAAREAEQHDAAQRRANEVGIRKRTRLENARNARRRVESELSELMDAVQTYLDVLDGARYDDAELDLLCRLHGVDRPATPDVDEDEYQRFLSDTLGPVSRKLQQFLRRYPLSVRQSPPGLMLARRLPDLFSDEPGTGRVYSRAKGLPGMLPDATREVAEPEIRARLWELYDQIRPERKSKYRAPGE